MFIYGYISGDSPQNLLVAIYFSTAGGLIYYLETEIDIIVVKVTFPLYWE
jgi:hypothetical protein